MEEMIKEEVEEFIKLIKKKNCKPFDCIQQFNLPILNALWKVTSGKRFDYDDRRLITIVEKLSLWFKRMGRPEDVLTFAFHWMTKIYPKFNEYDETLDTTHGIMNMMKESIEEHENTLDVNDPRDFIDKFLIEMTKTTNLQQNCQKVPKMQILQYLSTCRGWLGRDRTRKNSKLPKMA